MGFWVRLVSVVLVVLVGTGCTSFLAQRVVAPPNGGRTEVGESVECDGSRRMDVRVGPPTASLAMWVREPANGVKVKGTVLVLHGVIANHGWVHSTGKMLAKAGYRAVLVDLRGHGMSTGEHITYGVVESRDISQVIDFLQANKLAGEKVGVYGISYGAATAVQLAARDKRVAAVVAVACFSSLREEAPHFARTVLPVPGWFLSDADYDQVLREAGKIAGFDPEAASPVAAIARSTARVLLIHGEKDAVTPAEASRRIHAAAAGNGNTELKILEGRGHLIVSFELAPEVREMTREWFDRELVSRQ